VTQVLPHSFLYTQASLNAWGRWSLHRVGGYPTASSHVPRVRGRVSAPEGVLAVDVVVAHLGLVPDERHLQRRLIQHYQRDCAVRALMQRLLINSMRTYYDQLEEAQWAVHVRLTGGGTQEHDSWNVRKCVHRHPNAGDSHAQAGPRR